MTEIDQAAANVVPFKGGLHAIAEADVVRLMTEHSRRGALCDQLEACADALPDRPLPETADRLCKALLDLADAPAGAGAMLQRFGADSLTAILLDHVRARRLSDACHAADLKAALMPSASEDAVNPDALGYMLRGYFDNCRRAMDFEVLALLTLSGPQLTCGARTLLTANLAQHAGI